MMSRPATSWSWMAMTVASSCAASSLSGGTSQRSSARTRGTCFDSLARSISHSGCGYEPTSEVGNNICSSFPPRTLDLILGAEDELGLQRVGVGINDLAGDFVGWRHHRLIAHSAPSFEVRGVGDAAILHLQLVGLDPLAVFAEPHALRHDAVDGIVAEIVGDLFVFDALGAL